MIPDCKYAYQLAPDSHAFHKQVILAMQRFSADVDLSYQQIKKQLSPIVKHRYGYGAASLSPYGYYHPTGILADAFKQFSRGRLLKHPNPLKHPIYTYSYDETGHPVQVECHWVNGHTTSITLLLWHDHSALPLMLTYYQQNGLEDVPLTMLAWGEKHGEAEYRFQVGNVYPKSSVNITMCNTEIIQSTTEPMLLKRYEFVILPDGREQLACYSY